VEAVGPFAVARVFSAQPVFCHQAENFFHFLAHYLFSLGWKKTNPFQCRWSCHVYNTLFAGLII
jgi:hypothetical protein